MREMQEVKSAKKTAKKKEKEVAKKKEKPDPKKKKDIGELARKLGLI